MSRIQSLSISLFLVSILGLLIFQRTSWGTDFNNYIDMILNGEGDVLFRWLSGAIFKITEDPVLALNSMVILALFIKLYNSIRIVGVTALLILPFFISDIIAKDFGTIRQGLSIAILIPLLRINLRSIEKNEVLGYLLIVLIASMFHWSAFIMALAHLLIMEVSRNIKLFLGFLVIAFAASTDLQKLIGLISSIVPSDFIAYKLQRYFSYYDPYASGRFISIAMTFVEMLALLTCMYFSVDEVKIKQLMLRKYNVIRYILIVKILIILLASPQLARGLNFVNFASVFYVGVFVISTRSYLRAPMYISLFLMALLSAVAYVARYPDEFSRW
jgi:hypothetical protein